MKKLALVATVSLLALVALVVLNLDTLQRASFSLKLFSGAEQKQNFHRLIEVFPYATVPASSIAVR